MEHNQPTPQLVLPNTIASKTDTGRLLREVQALDSFLSQEHLRQPGEATKLPRTSRLLDDVIQTNKLNPLHDADRQALLAFVQGVYTNAPVMHISFSADPSSAFVQRIVTWLRHEIHPTVLIQVGLQPNMGAGCVIRTTNKYFDCSLRSRFKQRSDVLAQLLKGALA